MNEIPPGHQAGAGRRLWVHETRWLVVLLALALYEAFYLLGGFLESNALNAAGVIVFFVVLFVGMPGGVSFSSRTALKIAWWPLCALLVASVIHPDATQLYQLAKFSLFYLFVIVFSSMLYHPISESGFFNYYRLLVVFPLAASFVVGREQDVLGDVRSAGLLVNANSLALMAFLVPSIIPSDSSRTQRLLADLGALAVIVSTGTSGALIAYLLAAILSRLNGRSALLLGLAVVTASSTVLAFHQEIIDALSGIKATERFALQAQAVADASSDWQSGAVDFGALNHAYGASALSGVWRLVHWLGIYETFTTGSIDVLAFGFGPGSAHIQLVKLPHNDYLRVLYEQGIFGLVAFLGFYVTIVRRVSRDYRPVVIGFMIYCVTENVVDNFLFMSMFSVLIATGVRRFDNEYRPVGRRVWRR